ncbi:MAG: DUF1080 domain-containing protein [Chitinophagaceae bacterium]
MINLKSLSGICAVALIAACNNSGEQSTAETATPKDTSATAASSGDGFVSMFDGKTLNGWKGDTVYWRAENGEIIGEETPDKQLKNNSFLIWTGGEPSDFEFKAEFKINAEGNSGVQYRSEELKDIPLALKGYQADIDGANTYTGQNYEERGRGFLAMRGQIVDLKAGQKPIVTGSLGSSDSLKALIKVNDWNTIDIIAKGNHMKHFINGVLMSEATDYDSTAAKSKGVIGLQVHVMPAMKVEYRNLKIKVD